MILFQQLCGQFSLGFSNKFFKAFFFLVDLSLLVGISIDFFQAHSLSYAGFLLEAHISFFFCKLSLFLLFTFSFLITTNPISFGQDFFLATTNLILLQ
jgi:hypothetical protein